MTSGDPSKDTLTVLLRAQEVQHEEEIARNPYSLKAWLNFLKYKADSSPRDRYIIYERALKYLPRSYKLWHSYLNERYEKLENKCPATDKRFTTLVNTYERSLVHMHKMPRIWLDYCTLLVSMKKGTSTRRAFDRALQALPITQHQNIWELYVEWVRDYGVEETAVRVYRRFLMYDPSKREDFVKYLEDAGHFEEAARQLAICVDDDHYISPSGQTKHQMWLKLCDICANHPDSVSGTLNVEAIIRSGIARFSDEVGKLWCRLADYYVRQGQFEKSRDIFEEAINSITTVRDFKFIYDSYVEVEYSILTEKTRMQEMSDSSDDDEDDEEDKTAKQAADINMRFARLEYLNEKRPLLLNSVVLRQNPHNVFEWHKRVKLQKSDPHRALMTYIEAVKTVDPKLATGKLSGLWMSLAKHYEKHEDIENARTIFNKAVEVNFKNVDELANVYCGWAEMEMRHENFEQALAVMQQAVAEPASSIKRRKSQAAAQGLGKGLDGESYLEVPISDRLHKNVKVWTLYIDLEESLGTVETCRAAYDRIMDLKVITAQMCLNYASFLEENNFFEDSFRIYERSVALFGFPQVKIIWLTYIDKFLARYEGTKLERLRDLFEQAVAKVPPEDVAEFYIKYAKAEEAYGMARHAMAVYDRATRLVPEANKLDMYRLYILKVEQHYGVTKTRPVYERAISELNDDMSRVLCMEYASMERKLGEVDRARAILQHGSQFADPRREAAYWRIWKEFEEAHGNEDTFRDMLRVQRSVETAFSQVNYLAAEMMAGESIANAPISDLESLAKKAEKDAMEMADKKRKFVPASQSKQEDAVAFKRAAPATKAGLGSAPTNPDEIDINDDDDEEVDLGGIKTKEVPLAVFGSVAKEMVSK